VNVRIASVAFTARGAFAPYYTLAAKFLLKNLRHHDGLPSFESISATRAACALGQHAVLLFADFRARR
jgi:hypothetical protein